MRLHATSRLHVSNPSSQKHSTPLSFDLSNSTLPPSSPTALIASHVLGEIEQLLRNKKNHPFSSAVPGGFYLESQLLRSAKGDGNFLGSEDIYSSI